MSHECYIEHIEDLFNEWPEGHIQPGSKSERPKNMIRYVKLEKVPINDMQIALE